MQISTDMFFYSNKIFSQEISTLQLSYTPNVLFLKNPKSNNTVRFDKVKTIYQNEELFGWEYFNKSHKLALTIFND